MKFLSSIIILLLLVSPVFGGVDFDGDINENDYVSVPYSSDFDASNNLTLAAWVRWDGDTGEVNRQIITRDANTDGDSRTYGLLSTKSTTYFVAAAIFKAGESETLCTNTASTSFTSGTWHHAAMTYEYVTDGTSIITLYLDGEINKTCTNAKGPIGTTSVDLRIGNREYSGYEDPWNGGISDAAIWLATLTQAEIKLLALSKGKRMPLQVQSASLAGYWPLDDNIDGSAINGASYIDLSGNGNNGTGVDSTADSFNIAETVLTYP